MPRLRRDCVLHRQHLPCPSRQIIAVGWENSGRLVGYPWDSLGILWDELWIYAPQITRQMLNELTI